MLDRFIKENAPFIKIKAGESLTCDIVDYKEVPGMNDKSTVEYMLQIDGASKPKAFKSASMILAQQVWDLPDHGKGHRVQISRQGDGLQTKWTVKLMEITEEALMEDVGAEVADEPII